MIRNFIQASATADPGGQKWANACTLTKELPAGVYTCTLDDPMSEDDGGLVVTLIGASGMFHVDHTSATVKTITTYDAAGVPTNRAFYVAAIRRFDPADH